MDGLDILVVDDEQGIRDLLRDALSRHGHAVTCAENGVDAVSCVANGKVDAVFLDIRMPKGDGLTALKRIKSLHPKLPVVMITGYGQPDQPTEALELGSFACLVKPFSTRDVVAMLDVLQSLRPEAGH